MTFGLRCSEPARRPHPASLPVRVPTVESLPPASFSFASRLRLAVRLRLPSSAPIGSFHPIRFCPCWAHSAPDPSVGLFPPPLLASQSHEEHPQKNQRQPCHLLARERLFEENPRPKQGPDIP